MAGEAGQAEVAGLQQDGRLTGQSGAGRDQRIRAGGCEPEALANMDQMELRRYRENTDRSLDGGDLDNPAAHEAGIDGRTAGADGRIDCKGAGELINIHTQTHREATSPETDKEIKSRPPPSG